jgi:PHD/YefM family antitoxin component YafN of YafNO toxin-antitoxin module
MRGFVIELTNDVSLNSFNRSTPEFVTRMKQTGEPIVLKINGKAELVVQDAESYQRLLTLANRMESLEFLRRSLNDADAGRIGPFRKAVQSLGRRNRGK